MRNRLTELLHTHDTILHSLKHNLPPSAITTINIDLIKTPEEISVFLEDLQKNNVIRALHIKNLDSDPTFLLSLMNILEHHPSLTHVILKDKTGHQIDLSERTLENLNINAKDLPSFEAYLPQSKSLSSSWKNNEIVYAQFCAISIEKAYQHLQDYPEISAKDLYVFIAKLRHNIAEFFDSPSAQYIGQWRSEVETKAPHGPVTAIDNIKESGYQDFYPIILDRFNQYIKGTGRESGYLIRPYDPKLASEMISILDEDLSIVRLQLRKHRDATEGVMIMHPKGHLIPIVLQKIEPLFEEIKANPVLSERNIKHIAIIARHLALGMFLVRGSAATTEMFVQVLFKKIGLPPLAFKHVLPLDLEVITNPNVEDYINTFIQSFGNLLKYVHIKNVIDDCLSQLNQYPSDMKQKIFLAISNGLETSHALLAEIPSIFKSHSEAQAIKDLAALIEPDHAIGKIFWENLGLNPFDETDKIKMLQFCKEYINQAFKPDLDAALPLQPRPF